MKMSVVIPTYRRPKDLARCLQALERQTRSPDEVVVIVRDIDTETWTFLHALAAPPLWLKTSSVTQGGVVAAMNLGLTTATGDIIAFTDDDAAPHADWLERIEAHYQQSDRIGAVGGRDAIQYPGPWNTEQREVVGLLQWSGRIIGNHHMGVGQARAVDVLKGVNMSFRRQAVQNLRFDTRMLGTGAQVHFEVAFCLALKRQGWTLIYDPAIVVDHYAAQRFDEDQRNSFNTTAFFNEVHNETLALLDHFSPIQRIIFLAWGTLIGTRRAFGFVQCIRFLPTENWLAYQKWMISMQGRWQGWLTWCNTSNLSLSEERTK